MSRKSISSRIVWAVADDMGIDPADLPPLHDTVDTDALDALVDHDSDRRGGCTVRFFYAGRTVRVHDGEVTVETTDAAPGL